MNVFRQQYTDRKGQTKLSKKWYFELKDHQDSVKRIPGFTDKGATQELGRKLEKLVAVRTMGETPTGELGKWLETIPADLRDRLAKIGLLDATTVANSKPLAGHVEDFRQSLISKGTTEDNVKLVVGRVKKILDECKFKFYSDLKPSTVMNYLAKLRDQGKGISIQTSNFYLGAIKQFCRWMISDRRATESPMAHLQGQNVKTDRRHDRRNLTADELSRLLEATVNNGSVRNITGRDRAMLYRVAMETGFRRDELKSLNRGSFDIDSLDPSVTVIASHTKNRNKAILPLRRELVAELRQWFAERAIGPQDDLWPKMTDDTSRMLQKDLKAAGIPFVDDAGLFADFHALRHSFISLLASGNVHPKLAQSLARHSDINLTLSRYSHTILTDEAKALESLPQFPTMFQDAANETAENLRATGTDGPIQAGNVLQSGLQERGSQPCISLHRDSIEGGIEGTAQSHQAGKKKAQISKEKLENPGLNAERTRFELVVRLKPYADLANRCFRPLSHLSGLAVWGLMITT
jgi:site-specific recombinase XerC